ncbi:MAG: hypothetical protein FWD71_06770 [Oscillospiraceae bacterium]|nr:hypothetical protein [Oscillospiraceae bacterium]
MKHIIKSRKLRIPHILRISAICIFILFILGILSGCGSINRYFAELKSAYIYDKNAHALIKYPSEMTLEPNELLSFENNKTKVLEYNTLNLTLPKRDYETGVISDYNITIAYTVYNNELVLAQVPVQSAPYNYFTFNNSTYKVIITIDKENAFLVDLNATPDQAYKKLFDDSGIDQYFDTGAIKKLVFADMISLSPDDKYILYLSNRNYINTSPSSLDLYSYDIQTGAETEIMNFNSDKEEFLCWEKIDVHPDASGNFLFRDINIAKSDGKHTYSDIRRYSITQQKYDTFLTVDSKYNNYEMIDDQYIFSTVSNKVDGSVNKNTTLYIIDIYSQEVKSADAGQYNTIWDVQMSDSKDYLAYYGSYMNKNGIILTDIITLHIPTDDVVSEYNQEIDNYYLDSFYWCPGNVLIINFVNTVDLYNDLCRFHKITHSGKSDLINTADIT